MGKDFEVVAKYLQWKQNEIDILKMETPSVKTVIHKILLTWNRKLGPAATLENLEKALEGAERDTGAGVNWDVFNRAKKAILKKKKK